MKKHQTSGVPKHAFTLKQWMANLEARKHNKEVRDSENLLRRIMGGNRDS